MPDKFKIDIEDVSLYVDVTCYNCKRLVALSNSIEYKGRKYCQRCDDRLRPLKLK